jgi:hypothetical protein
MNASFKAMWFVLSASLIVVSLVFTMPQLQDVANQLEIKEQPYQPLVERTEIPKEPLFTGTQVIGHLKDVGKNGVPIEVDNVIFSSDTDLINYQDTVSLTSNYTQDIILNPDGAVQKIIFLKEV